MSVTYDNFSPQKCPVTSVWNKNQMPCEEEEELGVAKFHSSCPQQNWVLLNFTVSCPSKTGCLSDVDFLKRSVQTLSNKQYHDIRKFSLHQEKLWNQYINYLWNFHLNSKGFFFLMVTWIKRINSKGFNASRLHTWCLSFHLGKKSFPRVWNIWSLISSFVTIKHLNFTAAYNQYLNHRLFTYRGLM